MEFGSVTMSPPYDADDNDDLFPDLLSTMQSLEDNISNGLSATSMDVPTLRPFPNIVNVDDTDEDEETVSLKRAFNEQKERERPARTVTFPVREPPRQRAISPSYVSSSTPETVVLLPDENGEEQVYHGPNRNAILAKLNRQRKKKQMSELEETVKQLSSENEELKADQLTLTGQVTSLEAEVEYLKGVLANQSELAGLLQNIKATSLSFHSSIDSSASTGQIPSGTENKRRFPSDSMEGAVKRPKLTKTLLKVRNPMCLETIQSQPPWYPVTSSRSGTYQKSALYEDSLRAKTSKGVCLHVRDKKVSLEFCKSCSRRAEAAFQRDEDDDK